MALKLPLSILPTLAGRGVCVTLCSFLGCACPLVAIGGHFPLLRFAAGFPLALRGSLLRHFGNYLQWAHKLCAVPYGQAFARAPKEEYKDNVCGAPLSVLETSLPAGGHYFPGSSFPEILKCLTRFLILKKGWNIGAFSLVT